MMAFLIAGWVEGIRRVLVLGLVHIAGTEIEQAPSVGPLYVLLFFGLINSNISMHISYVSLLKSDMN